MSTPGPSDTTSRQLDGILGDCNCSGGLALGNHYTGCPQSFKAALSVLIEEAERLARIDEAQAAANVILTTGVFAHITMIGRIKSLTQAKETKQDKE